jgi:hypothetical protein
MRYILLAIGILLVICGVAFAFSKKERERTRTAVIKELPGKTEYTDTPDAMGSAKRRGYLMLGIGIVFVAIWVVLYS